ncbi:adenine nucleotide translocase lysine N-methyltransferase isoform X2 [Poecile atricapillus]|uniref:adenine nucleotide translocase lysine N-methyltransferase isoform X2 n=1 Tax=Poecile atricapillus TaxID=48891 RepID=UPI002738F438|nr:adenine nucleotide translocase lysine N-methyltransferase isoform X2 [Poecile atricapillus]
MEPCWEPGEPGELGEPGWPRSGGSLGPRGLLALAVASGAAAWATWAVLLMPGFRRVPLRLQVLEAYKQGLRPALGYELNPWLLSLANYRAWKAGYHGKVSFLKEDLWKVNLSDCHNVIVFLAPSVKPPLATKLLAELPDDARVVAGCFPFPSWSPSCTLGQGLEQVWAYDMKEVRREAQGSAQESQV